MIRVVTLGSFQRTTTWLQGLIRGEMYRDLHRYGRMGVDALAAATPRRSGTTAMSWGYDIRKTRDNTTISWSNSNVNDGVQIALLIQYGHGTGTGGYVQGYDYINPAARPIFDQIANDVWEKVTRG